MVDNNDKDLTRFKYLSVNKKIKFLGENDENEELLRKIFEKYRLSPTVLDKFLRLKILTEKEIVDYYKTETSKKHGYVERHMVLLKYISEDQKFLTAEYLKRVSSKVKEECLKSIIVEDFLDIIREYEGNPNLKAVLEK